MHVPFWYAGRAVLLSASLACLGAAGSSDKLLRIEAIDVEGGAATLYITPEHRSLLIDSGWSARIGATDPDSAQRIIAAARRQGLARLDYVLITHYHADHVGGVLDLLRQFPVGTVMDHGPNSERPSASLPRAFAFYQPALLYPKYLEAVEGHARRILKPGETLEIGSLLLTVVSSDAAIINHPLWDSGEPITRCETMLPMDQDGGEENARSVGVVLTYGHARIASFGDLTWNMEKNLVCPRDKVGPVDLFFVSNHGADLSNSPALLQALRPRIALMGNGPKKGGDMRSFDAVSGSPRLERLWQLHLAERADAQHNAAPAYIANLSGDIDQHYSLEVIVKKDGTLTVLNERTGFAETYPANPISGLREGH